MLDLGCGHGVMSVRVAQAGTARVVVDLNPHTIESARDHIEISYPELA